MLVWQANKPTDGVDAVLDTDFNRFCSHISDTSSSVLYQRAPKLLEALLCQCVISAQEILHYFPVTLLLTFCVVFSSCRASETIKQHSKHIPTVSSIVRQQVLCVCVITFAVLDPGFNARVSE